MRVQVEKWGNSLAVRLPIEWTRVAGLHEGDMVEAEVTAAGTIELAAAQPFEKAAFLERMRKLRASMPMTTALQAMHCEDGF